MANDIASKLARRDSRKAFRAQNRAYIEAVADAAGTHLNLPETGPGASNACPKARKPRKAKKRRKVPARKRAFNRLKAAAKAHTLARALKRHGGFCEVGILCGGTELAVLAYHVFPAATGNALKYDVRNLLGACARDNGGEYFDRKRGTYERWDAAHKAILGEPLWQQLKSEQGRKQISAVEANEMAERIEGMTAAGLF